MDNIKIKLTAEDYVGYLIKFIVYLVVFIYLIGIFKGSENKNDKVVNSVEQDTSTTITETDKVKNALNGLDKDLKALYASLKIPKIYGDVKIEDIFGNHIVVNIIIWNEFVANTLPFGNLLVQVVLEKLRKAGFNPHKDGFYVYAYVYCPKYSIGEGKDRLEICNSSEYSSWSDTIKYEKK